MSTQMFTERANPHSCASRIVCPHRDTCSWAVEREWDVLCKWDKYYSLSSWCWTEWGHNAVVTQLMSWHLCNSQQLPYNTAKNNYRWCRFLYINVCRIFLFLDLFFVFCLAVLLNMSQSMHTYSLIGTCYIRPQTNAVFEWNQQLTHWGFHCIAGNLQIETW